MNLANKSCMGMGCSLIFVAGAMTFLSGSAELGLTVLWLLPTLAILVGIIEAVRLNRKQREARRRHILGEPETTSSAADGNQSSSESKISYE